MPVTNSASYLQNSMKLLTKHCSYLTSFYFVLFCFGFFSIFCSPLRRYSELENYLWSMYASAAQYNHPPRYPVTRICDAIDGASSVNGTLTKIAAAVFAYRGNVSCYINHPTNETETDVGWRWQVNFLVHISVCD